MAVRLGGHVAVIGILSGLTQNVNVAAIFSQNLKVSGITVGSRLWFEGASHFGKIVLDI